MLDRRSLYGQGFFPEPFLVDDTEGESGEFRLDWLHTTTRGAYDDSFRTEIEQGFGLLTLEIAGPYDRAVAVPDRTAGFGSIELGARHPVYQYVSPGGAIDSTFGVGFEVALPTDSHVGKNTEFVPKVFNDLRLGSRFSAQTLVGVSVLSGGGDEGGRQTLEYGVTLGYSILHHDLALPGNRTDHPGLRNLGREATQPRGRRRGPGARECRREIQSE